MISSLSSCSLSSCSSSSAQMNRNRSCCYGYTHQNQAFSLQEISTQHQLECWQTCLLREEHVVVLCFTLSHVGGLIWQNFLFCACLLVHPLRIHSEEFWVIQTKRAGLVFWVQQLVAYSRWISSMVSWSVQEALSFWMSLKNINSKISQQILVGAMLARLLLGWTDGQCCCRLSESFLTVL